MVETKIIGDTTYVQSGSGWVAISGSGATAGGAAAEAYNKAYQANQLPVLPQYAPGGGARYSQEEQLDAAREQAKHMAAFHPEEYYGVSISSMANVPLSQIASRYGSGFADIVQGYYTRNPTAEAQAINQAYAYQQARTIGPEGVMQQREIAAMNPYDPNSAAGIAWDVARITGGTGNITESLKGTAKQQIDTGYIAKFGDITTGRIVGGKTVSGSAWLEGLGSVKGMETVPIRGPADYTDRTVDVYMAIGGYQGVRIPNAKLAVDYATGEFGVYVQPPGHSIYTLIGGGGRAAAQSGMFQIGTSLWDKEHTYELSDIGKMQPVSLEYQATHSKAGAEAYGGFSRPLIGNLLAPNEQYSRYYGSGAGNIANLVQQQPAGKAEAPGAYIPWGMSAKEPAVQYMNEMGLTGQAIPTSGGRLVGGKTVASVASVTGVTGNETITVGNEVITITPYQKAAMSGYGGGLIGYALWGEKSPEVIKGFAGSVADFAVGVATLGQWQPFKESMRVTENGQVYDYGEYSKAGASLGESFRKYTGGYSVAQLEAYGTAIENKPLTGPWYDPLAGAREKIVYGTGKVVATHPEKIVTAYGGGGVLVVGGAVVGGALETVGAGTGIAAAGARAALTGGSYVLPVIFTGAMGYSVTEGGTASPGRSLIHVGEMLPEAAGATLGGGSAYLVKGSNLPIGFSTKKNEYIPGYEPSVIDLTKQYPSAKVGGKMGTTTYPEPLPTELARQSLAEPFVMVGKTRVGVESARVGEAPAIAMTELPGVRATLTGTELGSVSESTGFGLLGLEKSKTSARYSMDKMVGEYQMYSQPPSAKTILMREKQAAAWQAPQPTGALPMDFLPGVGRELPLTRMSIGYGEPLRPMPGEVSLEYVGAGIGKSTERGLTISGAGMSSQMLESVVTKGAIKAPSSYASAMDVVISQETGIARVKPAVKLAEQQKILPSATESTFTKKVSISNREFADMVSGVIESGKRASTKAGAKRLPTGMQMDYLRDVLKQRQPISFPQKAAAPKVVFGPVELGPTRATFEAQQRVQVPAVGSLQWYRQKQAPKPAQIPTSTPVQVQPVITSQVPRQVQTPTQIPQQIPRVSQKQTPYVVPVQIQQPTTAQQQKQTPYVPPYIPTMPTPSYPATGAPRKQTPYVPPSVVTPPSYPPTPRTPQPPDIKPPDEIKPPVPIPFGFPSLGGGAPGGGGRIPRRAAFMETFMMGLDLSAMGRRTKRAKSWTTPKKYKSKKKGGKK